VDNERTTHTLEKKALISERRINDTLVSLSDRERTHSWSSATFDSGALSYIGSAAWMPSDPTNVMLRIGNRLMVIRGASPNVFLPNWVRPTIEGILPILKLEPGWDLAGGQPINAGLVRPAIKI